MIHVARLERGSALLPDVARLMGLYRVFYGRPDDGDVEACRDFLHQRLERSESVIFVALTHAAADAAPAGFTQLYPSFTSVGLARTWILNDLFVHPDHRRRGVAEALLARAEAFAREDGAARLELLTARDNAPAKALYESRGWKRDEVYDRYVLRL